MNPRLCVISATALAVAACASPPVNKPIDPARLVNLTLQPVRIAPSAQGGLLLGEWTGCQVDFVGRGTGDNVWQFNVAPTRRVPTFEACLASLRTQPGVEAVSIAQ